MRRLVRRCMSTAAQSTRPEAASLITTPIFYVNGKPHIGHVFSGLLADMSARSRRMGLASVRFTTGTDEHGNKVADAAEAAGMDPGAYCEGVSSEFRSCFDGMGIDYDAFIRTTDASHAETVRWLWHRLRDRGYIRFGEYDGWYCKSDEAFLTERQLVKGDDGTVRSAESGHLVERVSEHGWVFALSAMREPLIRLLEDETTSVRPASRRAEMLGLLRSPSFSDVFVSRPTSRARWGIPVPEDTPGGGEPHTVYVWLDALANYLTVAGGAPAARAAETAAPAGSQEGFALDPDTGRAGPAVDDVVMRRRRGLTWAGAASSATHGAGVPAGGAAARPGDPVSSGPWSSFAWPPAVQVVGKDITRFHCVIWPAMLLAAGLQPPPLVVAHGHFTSGRRKMSKSLGNVVCPTALVAGEPTRFDDGVEWQPPPEALRWYLASKAFLDADADFDVEELRSSWDDVLANDVGNLLSRVTGHAILPDGRLPDPPRGDFASVNRDLLLAAASMAVEARHAFDECSAGDAVACLAEFSNELNGFITREEPWRLGPKGKDDPAALATVLWFALEGIRVLATAMQPALPGSASAILDVLAVPHDRRRWADAQIEGPDGWRRPGTPLNLPPTPLGAKKRPPVLLFSKSTAGERA